MPNYNLKSQSILQLRGSVWPPALFSWPSVKSDSTKPCDSPQLQTMDISTPMAYSILTLTQLAVLTVDPNIFDGGVPAKVQGATEIRNIHY
uniref:Uncharacterized protein n=1 Tax=Anguilla anguilla TaxID=7936 RepID=A0A0E9WDN6_ANGAN